MGNSSSSKYLCVTNFSTNYGLWHPFPYLEVHTSHPEEQVEELQSDSHSWPSDESADCFMPIQLSPQRAFPGLLVLLGHLQVSFTVTVVSGTVQGTERAHTGLSYDSYLVWIHQRSWECLGGWHFPGSSQEAVREQNETHRNPVAMSVSSSSCFLSGPFPSNLSITSKREGRRKKHWARMKFFVETLM